MKRYTVDGYASFMTENKEGEWILYKDYETEKSAMSSNAVLADVRADVEYLIGYLSLTFEIMEKEPEEKRVLRRSEILQIKNICKKVSEHFS